MGAGDAVRVVMMGDGWVVLGVHGGRWVMG